MISNPRLFVVWIMIFQALICYGEPLDSRKVEMGGDASFRHSTHRLRCCPSRADEVTDLFRISHHTLAMLLGGKIQVGVLAEFQLEKTSFSNYLTGALGDITRERYATSEGGLGPLVEFNFLPNRVFSPYISAGLAISLARETATQTLVTGVNANGVNQLFDIKSTSGVWLVSRWQTHLGLKMAVSGRSLIRFSLGVSQRNRIKSLGGGSGPANLQGLFHPSTDFLFEVGASVCFRH